MMTFRTMMLAVAGVAASVTAQDDALRFEHVEMTVDSGVLAVPADGSGLVYSAEVETPGSDWIRVYLDGTVLPQGAELILTSARDGAQHRLNRETLAQWSNSSAYFVGDLVFIELYVPAGAGGSRLMVNGADAGLPPLAPRTICGPTDDRELSRDPRAGRFNWGCTVWLFNNRPDSMSTAGHCAPSGGNSVWLNVPIQRPSGGTVPPHPDDQYAVDGSSISATNGGVGNDWTVFGAFPNSNTGLSMVDAQLKSYVLATQAPPSDGRPINITGHGTTTSPVPPSYSRSQKSHTGPLFSVTGNTLRYRPDTSGGNSGSCVYDEQDRRAIGVHTHGGCGSSATSSNQGTSISNPGWRTAFMTPRGVAGGPTGGVINIIGDRPDRAGPLGDTGVTVELVADFLAPDPIPGVTLHSNDGSGWVETPMANTAGDEWFINFPPTECGSIVRYYFSALDSTGAAFTYPPSAPTIAFETVSSGEWAVLAESDFETDAGWTVENTGVSAGGWERGVPAPLETNGGPRDDGDGSGSCWTTGLAQSVNLNGGPTRLVSPVLDLSGATDPYFDVSVYINNDASGENLEIEFSDDGGSSWTLVRSQGPTMGWTPMTFRIADSVALTGTFRARLSIADLGSAQTIEAGVDAFAVRDVTCPVLACNAADIAAPFGVLDLADVQTFIAAFLGGDPIADLTKPFGVFDLADVQTFVDAFNQGCP